MDDLLAARAQMALSLGFHIVFAAFGIAMPLLMILAEARWLRTGDRLSLELAKAWSKAVAVLFAVGAVSGTVLSFELGLLWPAFMRAAGPVIGMPFSLEGFAFFLEAIFLGVYLYGWDRVSPRAHWLAGLAVLVCGTLSGVFVVTANAWMNAPAGFDLVDGRFENVRPFAAMLNPAAPAQVLHMTLASFQAVGFAVAGLHAWRLLAGRRPELHRRAYGLGLAVGAAAALLQPLAGDVAARSVARRQPAKFAAMEGRWETERGAALELGPLRVPKLLSLMAHGDPDAEVTGLRDVPEDERPPVAPVRFSFQLMVACGLALAALGAAALWRRKRDGRWPESPLFLRLAVLAGPLGFVAVEAGWTVTEVGRQPWIVQGILRTADAVTPMPGLSATLAVFTIVYLGLTAALVVLLRRQLLSFEREAR